MKITKMTVLMIAVVAIGLFALPSTFSVNTGQHTFKQINTANPSAFCGQCHGGADSVKTELAASDNGIKLVPGTQIHSTRDCGNCHELTAGYGNASQTGSVKTEHAAVIPSCLKCHGAGGIGDFNVANELSGAKEAHGPLYNASIDPATVATANTDDLACLGCHTAVPKSGTIVYDYTITKTATLGATGLTVGQ